MMGAHAGAADEPSFATTALCMVLIVYCGVLFLPLSCLTGYHIHIISNGETTKEQKTLPHHPLTEPLPVFLTPARTRPTGGREEDL